MQENSRSSKGPNVGTPILAVAMLQLALPTPILPPTLPGISQSSAEALTMGQAGFQTSTESSVPRIPFLLSTRPPSARHHHLSPGLPIASACTQLPPHSLRNFSQEPRIASQLHDCVRGVRSRLVAAPLRPLHRVEAPLANMILSWVRWNSCWNILYFCTETN